MTFSGDATARIGQFLSKSFDDHEFRPDDDIFALGFASSMFAMELVNFVESEFQIEVDTDDLEMDNFRSVAAIASFVERKQSAPEALGGDHG